MTQIAHTPGPWEAGIELVHTADKLAICRVYHGIVKNNSGQDERDANARLITAAPDFFKAVAGDPDLLDQPIDWVVAIMIEFENLLSWAKENGYQEEDPAARVEATAQVRYLVENCRKAIKKATSHGE